MRNRRLAFMRAASLGAAALMSIAVACPAQRNSFPKQADQSPDPAIRWQFNTHG